MDSNMYVTLHLNIMHHTPGTSYIVMIMNNEETYFRFVFLIPAESGEKITLGISTMLNMTVFLMTVMQVLVPD